MNGKRLIDALIEACSRYISDRGKLKIGFTYELQIFAPSCEGGGLIRSSGPIHNLMPNAAIQKFMSSGLDGATQVSSFYIGAYANDRTPVATDTSANLTEYGEITTFEEGSRQLWNKGSLQGNIYDSSASPTVLTATEETTVAGVFMSTDPTFGSLGGILWSAVLAPSPEVIQAGSTLRIPASISLVNA